MMKMIQQRKKGREKIHEKSDAEVGLDRESTDQTAEGMAWHGMASQHGEQHTSESI